MRYGVALLVFLIGTLSGLQFAKDSETARLTFIVSTTFGEPLEKAQVILTSIGPKQRVTGLSGLNGEVLLDQVPFGLYEVEVRVPGFERRRERVGVYQPQLVYRLGLVLGYPHSAERSEIAGSVSSASGSKADLWVRLIPVFGGDLIENAVDRAGSFRLTAMAPGRYILILFEKERVLATKPVEVLAGSKTVNFSLN